MSKNRKIVGEKKIRIRKKELELVKATFERIVKFLGKKARYKTWEEFPRSGKNALIKIHLESVQAVKI